MPGLSPYYFKLTASTIPSLAVDPNLSLMKRFKKAGKLFLYAIIIVLASIGLGINAALLPSYRREESNVPTIELVEEKEEDMDILEEEQKE